MPRIPPLRLALFAIALSALGVHAQAQTPGPGDPDTAFERMNRDGNGWIDAEEFRNGMLRRFAVLDRNGDGVLDAAEIPDHTRIAAFADGEGTLDATRFHDAIPQVMAQLDVDDDGVVTLDELRTAQQEPAR